MKNSKITKILIFLFVVLALLGAIHSVNAAVQYQKCFKNGNCTVGEFLYDDSYVPIATANCVLTSRFPDSSVFLNSIDMDSASDGWYSYSFIATGSAGLYRSKICCTAGSDYLCLDKTFEVEASSSALTKQEVADAVWDEPRASHTQSGSFGQALQNIVPSASDIATAVWGYSGRTLNNFGTLPSDVWSVSTRTLSSFGNFISSILENDSTESIATQGDIVAVKSEIEDTRELLEQVVNKPIINNFLEEEHDIDLESKLIQSRATMAKLSVDSNLMDSKLGLIDVKWKEMDTNKLKTSIKEIEALNRTIIDGTKKIKESWSFPQAENLFTQASALNNRITIIQNELIVEEKSEIVLDDIKGLSNSLGSFISLLGLPKDSPEKLTLFGKINEVKKLADTFDLYSSDAEKLLFDWKKYQLSEIQEKTNKLADNLAIINRLPNSIKVGGISPKDNLSKKLKNRILSIKATISANKILLAKNTEKPFSNSWLEEGSVVFKTLLTNPSTRITQVVPLKYYLPMEVKKEDVIEVDDDLKIEYDVEKKQFYVEGKFSLEPNESRVVSVRVQDVWEISVESIESLRRQAEELSKPLEKTSYFGQGVTIKSNIDIALDKILFDQKSAITPEAKIKNYYEAQIALKTVKDQLSKLQDLVAQSGSFGSMAGFVGGAQAIAVWGIIIIMIAGFVFLVLYMRTLQGKNLFVEPVKTRKLKENDERMHPNYIRLAIVFFFFGSVISSITSIVVFKMLNKPNSQIKASNIIVSPVPEEKVLGTAEEKKSLIVIVKDLEGDILMIRENPDGKIVNSARSGDQFNFVEEKNNWVRIELKDGTGWVAKKYIEITTP